MIYLLQSPFVLCRLFKKNDGNDENFENSNFTYVEESVSSSLSVLKSSTEDPPSEHVTPLFPALQPTSNDSRAIADSDRTSVDPLEYLDYDQSEYQMVCFKIHHSS